MKTWTLQKGFPLVTVQRKGKELLVQQERFSLNMKPEIQPSDARWVPSLSPRYLFCTLRLKYFWMFYNHKFLRNLTRLSLSGNSLKNITFLPKYIYIPNRLCVTDWNIGKSDNLPVFSFYSSLWHIPLSYVTDEGNYSKYRSVSLLDKKSGLAIFNTFLKWN